MRSWPQRGKGTVGGERRGEERREAVLRDRMQLMYTREVALAEVWLRRETAICSSLVLAHAFTVVSYGLVCVDGWSSPPDLGHGTKGPRPGLNFFFFGRGGGLCFRAWPCFRVWQERRRACGVRKPLCSCPVFLHFWLSTQLAVYDAQYQER